MRSRENLLAISFALALALSGNPVHAEEQYIDDIDGPELDGGGENASNPLARVSNTDFRWQHLDLVDGRGRINDFFIDGSFMATPKLKLKYELHYWETDVTGSSEKDFESLLLKAIYFAREGVLDNDVKYRLALGFDLDFDFDNEEKGIGSGSDEFGPFAGFAFGFPSGLTAIPIVQHFFNMNGDDVNTTAARLIALQPLPLGMWLKADIKAPYDWEESEFRSLAELQWGKNINERLALYVDVLRGIGNDRVFDWGGGVGIRFKY